MGDQDNLSAIVKTVLQLHEPRLDLWNSDIVLGLVQKHAGLRSDDEIQECVKADQHPLTVGKFVKRYGEFLLAVVSVSSETENHTSGSDSRGLQIKGSQAGYYLTQLFLKF